MNKIEMISYLNKIRPFINLNAVCNNYNAKFPTHHIDYNNLRAVLNGISITRVSEEKLLNLIAFIKGTLFKTVFDLDESSADARINEKAVKEIVEEHCKSLTSTLLKEINNGI